LEPPFEKPSWFSDIEDHLCSIPQQECSISLTDFQSAVKKLKNWSAPGFDEVHGFWLKKLSAIHPQMLSLFKKALNDPPPELCQRITHLFIKDPAKGFDDVANYRPIACLSILWKLLTSIVGNKIYSHFQEFSLFPKSQKGNRRGTKEHLLDLVL